MWTGYNTRASRRALDEAKENAVHYKGEDPLSLHGAVPILMKTGNIEGKMEKDFFGKVITPFRLVNNKVIVPNAEEIERNPRSRSAKLRIAEKKIDDWHLSELININHCEKRKRQQHKQPRNEEG